MENEVADRAEHYFTQGYSCAQSVLAACGEALGLAPEQLIRLGAGLGAGIGGLRETCGAVLAMSAILGWRLMPNPQQPLTAKEKALVYQRVQAAVAAFDQTFQTHHCLALLKQASIEKQAGVPPEERTAAYYAKRPCVAFVRFCAQEALR